MEKQLYRSKQNRIFFGVAGGLAEFLEVDPLIIRLIFVILTIFDGLGFILYFLLVIIVPLDLRDKGELEREYIKHNSEKWSKFANNLIGYFKKVMDELQRLPNYSWRNIFGFFFLVFGLWLLFASLAPHGLFGIGRLFFWPLLIILFGAMLIARKKHRS